MSTEPSLDPAGLLQRARRDSGLTQFDDPSPEEPLEVLTRALTEEACLNAGGRYYWSARLLGILVTRLRAREWFRRHPEILEERIHAPIIILGLSRTGTTLLQRLISSDSRFYSAAYWEARFPVPVEDDLSGAQRIAVAKAEIDALLAANPDLASVHPFDAMGADEDILILDQKHVGDAGACAELLPMAAQTGSTAGVPILVSDVADVAVAEEAARRAGRAVGAEDTDAPGPR
jgi:hypothetical protein